jgi:hypothetical protein
MELSSVSVSAENGDLFTPVFKYFRHLSNVKCSKEAYSVSTHPEQFQRCDSNILFDIDSALGLQPLHNWSLYSCRFSDGLYFLCNPFTDEGQRQWIDRCVNVYACQTKTSVGDNTTNQSLARLRWATLGYHYDWTNKIYKPDDHTHMPDELAQLCHVLMKFLSYSTGTSDNRQTSVFSLL